MHSRKTLPHVAIWKNFKVFLKKNLSIFPKNFERFENSYYFNRVLLQICYNLLKNNFAFRHEKNVDVGMNAIGKHRVKNIGSSAFETRFCYHILNMEKDKKERNKTLMKKNNYSKIFSNKLKNIWVNAGIRKTIYFFKTMLSHPLF